MISPKGPSTLVASGSISPSITISACAGIGKPVRSLVIISTGAPRRAPAISYSLLAVVGALAANRETGSAPMTMAQGIGFPIFRYLLSIISPRFPAATWTPIVLSSCNIIRRIARFISPVSGSRSISSAAVPMYLPPSRGKNLGAGNFVRSILSPSMTFSVTGPVSTSIGGMSCLVIIFVHSLAISHME